MKIKVSYVPVDGRLQDWDEPYRDPYIDEEMENVEDFTFTLKEKENGEYDMYYEMKGDGRMNSRRLTVSRANCEVHDDDLDI